MNELRCVEPVAWQVYAAYVRTYTRTWPPGNGESRHQENGSPALKMGRQNKSILHVLHWDWRDPYGNQQFFSGPVVSLWRSGSDILSGNPSQRGCIPLSATLQSFVLHCNDLPPFARARSQHRSAATECLFIIGWEWCSFLSDEPSYVIFATILLFSSCVWGPQAKRARDICSKQ